MMNKTCTLYINDEGQANTAGTDMDIDKTIGTCRASSAVADEGQHELKRETQRRRTQASQDGLRKHVGKRAVVVLNHRQAHYTKTLWYRALFVRTHRQAHYTKTLGYNVSCL